MLKALTPSAHVIMFNNCRRFPALYARRNQSVVAASAPGATVIQRSTTLISRCIGLAVREVGMTIDEAVQAVTRGGAAALRRDDLGRLTPGSAGR